MKKKLTITINEDVWNYLEANFINKSALIRTLITKFYTEKRINIKEELPKEVEEILNERATQTN